MCLVGELWWWFKYSVILLYSSKEITEWKWTSRDTEGERRGSGDDEEKLNDSIYHKIMPWIQFVFHTWDFWAPLFSAAAIFSRGSWRTPCTIVAPKWLASNTFEAARTLLEFFLPTCPCFGWSSKTVQSWACCPNSICCCLRASCSC